MNERTYNKPDVTVSIVTHGHGKQVEQLVTQVLQDSHTAQLILTMNIEEDLDLPDDDRLILIRNVSPKGFGANHNLAFTHCETAYYCTLNPDIVLRQNTFAQLLDCLTSNEAAVAGPLVLSSNGEQEDSWRKFPTAFSLAMKAIGHDTTVMKTKDQESSICPDWIAGMCMLFDAKQYSAVNGFDESIFLYYEDVDICARLWQRGLVVVACSKAAVIHNAQRASRREWQHMKWHVCSMAKYLRRYTFRMPKVVRKNIAE